MVEIFHYKDVNDKPATMVDLGQSYLSCSYHYIRKYHIGEIPPNYPMPACINTLNFIAAYPIGPSEDFYDIGNAGLKLLD